MAVPVGHGTDATFPGIEAARLNGAFILVTR